MTRILNVKREQQIIAVDFDGTCVTHEYPVVGKEIGAATILKDLTDKGHQLILFTMRSGVELQDAVNWFNKHNIPLYGLNENPTQKSWTASPKPYANIYIDDAALGCPLSTTLFDGDNLVTTDRPFVDWLIIEDMLTQRCLL